MIFNHLLYKYQFPSTNIPYLNRDAFLPVTKNLRQFLCVSPSIGSPQKKNRIAAVFKKQFQLST